MAEVQTTGVIFVNGFDLSETLKSIEETADVNMLDNTNFTNTGAKTFQPGLNERRVSGEGYFAYNSSDDGFSIDKLYSDAFDSSATRLLTYCTEGAVTVGDIAVMMNTKQASYSVNQIPGELIMVNFEAVASAATGLNPYARGVWLMSQTVTGAVNGSTYDNAAGSTGYLAQIHNTNADGTATVKVQHSTNGTVWADLIDFGAFAALTADQSFDTAASVNRYVRAIVTAIGGTTAKVSVAIKLGYTG